MSWGYGTLCTEVYDLDKPVGSSFGDVEYYEQALRGVTGPVLEPAVGTGRILIPLLEAGHQLEGYDNSAEMLGVCREHCRERNLDPPLSIADMTTFVQTSRYGAVIVPTGSITLLSGREALVQALGCFRECLKPGGQLIIDVGAPSLASDPGPMQSWVSGETIWTMQTQRVDYDAAQNQTLYWLRYEKWRDGNLVATELQLFRLQHWSLTEFPAILAECGFGDIVVSGDHQAGIAPGPDTDMWTFHATCG